MKKFDLEFTVGLFVIAGIICLAYLSVRLAKMEIVGGSGYEVVACFTNTGGLKTGASVTIGGVEVGRVKSIALEDYLACVVMHLPKGLAIQDDAIVSIKTKGLIGEKFIEISPGASETLVEPGGRIRDTQPAIDFEEMISNFVFGKV